MQFDPRAALKAIKARPSKAAPINRLWREPDLVRIAAVAPLAPAQTLPRRAAIPDLDRPGDEDALLEHLHRRGPMTYGAAARDLGWGATRTVLAETRLLKRGVVRFGAHGRIEPVPSSEHPSPPPSPGPDEGEG